MRSIRLIILSEILIWVSAGQIKPQLINVSFADCLHLFPNLSDHALAVAIPGPRRFCAARGMDGVALRFSLGLTARSRTGITLGFKSTARSFATITTRRTPR